MLLRSCLGILLVGFLGRHVEADHHDKTLLKRNALGYTKHNREVSYSANFKVGTEVEGSCVNGHPPEPKIAPNVQTTKEDTTCQALVSYQISTERRIVLVLNNPHELYRRIIILYKTTLKLTLNASFLVFSFLL